MGLGWQALPVSRFSRTSEPDSVEPHTPGPDSVEPNTARVEHEHDAPPTCAPHPQAQPHTTWTSRVLTDPVPVVRPGTGARARASPRQGLLSDTPRRAGVY